VLFEDREDAGRKLAAALSRYEGKECVVLALPRGGLPVGAAIAAKLHAPLDVLLVRKIGARDNPELAVGAIVDGDKPIIVRNEEIMRLAGTTAAEFDATAKEELGEIERRRRIYMQGRAPVEVKGRVAIVVDDGIATGATMHAALKAVRQRGPKELVLAVPVAPDDALEILRKEADQVVCLDTPEPFGAVGYFYRNFGQLTDDDVIALLTPAGDGAQAKEKSSRPQNSLQRGLP